MPQTYAYSGRGEAIPVTYFRDLPIITGFATLFGKDPIPVRFQVDSGRAISPIMFWMAFIDKHDLASGVHNLREVDVTGFGGTTKQKQGRIQSMQIGSTKIPEPEVGLNDFQYGDPAVFDANLGTGFLKQFKVVFDLPHDHIIFERPLAQ